MSKITYKVDVYGNGDKYWYLNGKRHREDGPAIEFTDSDFKAWYLNGVAHTEESFNEEVSLAVEMTIAEIEELVGKKVKVIK